MTSDTRTLARLRNDVRGTVIGPDDADYDGARSVYFTAFDRRPAAVVRPADAPDVVRALEITRDAGLPLSVRGGGHSPAGHGACDDGIVLDLSALRTLDIAAEERTAWVGAGMTAGEYTAETARHGLVTGFGDAPSVGVGGITLAGGVGFLHRRFGLTIDNLLAAEIVTADGRTRRVDADSDADLFWAIDGIDRTQAEAILDGLAVSTAPMRVAQVRVLGGAVARVDSGETAFAHRGRGAMLNIAAMFEDPGQQAQHDAWADALADGLRHGAGGAYIGFLGNVDDARVEAAYPPATWQRLRSIKAAVDPTNLFRSNQNIPPA